MMSHLLAQTGRRASAIASLIVALSVLSPVRTFGDTLAGPATLPYAGTDTSWGLQFTALQNVNLTGFQFHQLPSSGPNPFTTNITLTDTSAGNSVVYSATINPGQGSVVTFSGLNVALTSGDVYQLVASSNIVSGAHNEVFQYLVLNSPPLAFPIANAHLNVTSAVINGATSGFGPTNEWPGFTNITTAAAAAVPEPVSFAVWSVLGLVGSGATWLRKRRTPA